MNELFNPKNMSSESCSYFFSCKEKLKTENLKWFEYQSKHLSDLLQSKENEIIDNEKKIVSIKDQIIDNEISIKILDFLKNSKIEEKKNNILNIINTALFDIFQDDLHIDIKQEVTKTGSVKYNIILYQRDIEIGQNEHLLSTTGGGVLSIISVLFKILIGYLYSKNKLYIFDESFSQVSEIYRERLSKFLREFAEKYGFTIIVVSQTGDLNKEAHLIYTVDYSYDDNSIKILNIKNKVENYKNIDNSYILKIKNFQSIKNTTFEFKGFTIIEGPNNSGKSASLRAFKAILFNDFDQRYLRMGTKETSIHLIKKFKDEIEGEIELIYKNKKVIFVIEGEKYLGKNLADDVLKKFVEKLGFKYIDVKKMYKNINAQLKKQTEKIAYMSQYDNLFIVGDKSNNIEKIFNFLFNTELITSIKIDYQENNNTLKSELKVLENQNELQKNNFKILSEKMNIIKLLYSIKLIEERNILKQDYSEKINIKEKIVSKKDQITFLLTNKSLNHLKVIDSAIELKASMKIFVSKKDQITKEITLLTDKFEKLNDLNEKININKKILINIANLIKNKKNLLNNLNLSKKDQIPLLKNKIEFINNIIKKDIRLVFNDVLKLKKNLETKELFYKKKENFVSKKDQLIHNISEIDLKLSEYQIEECPYCKGTGKFLKHNHK